MGQNIQHSIARAIQRADKSYFFENYDKQAKAVIRALEDQGYVILPETPEEKTLKAVADSIHTGRMRPEQHILNVYQTLAAALKK